MSFYHDSSKLRMLLGEEQLAFTSRLETLDYVRSPYNAITYPPLKQRWRDNEGRYYVCEDGAHGIFDIKLPRDLSVVFPDLYQIVTLKRYVKLRGKRKLVMLNCKVLQVSNQRPSNFEHKHGSVCVARVELGYQSSQIM